MIYHSIYKMFWGPWQVPDSSGPCPDIGSYPQNSFVINGWKQLAGKHEKKVEKGKKKKEKRNHQNRFFFFFKFLRSVFSVVFWKLLLELLLWRNLLTWDRNFNAGSKFMSFFFLAETFRNKTKGLQLCYFFKNPEDTAQSKKGFVWVWESRLTCLHVKKYPGLLALPPKENVFLYKHGDCVVENVFQHWHAQDLIYSVSVSWSVSVISL